MARFRAALAAAALSAAAAAEALASVNVTTFAPLQVDPVAGEVAAVLTVSSTEGLVGAGPAVTIPPPLAPCGAAFIPDASGGQWVVPGNMTALVFVSAATGKVTRSVPLSDAWELPFLVFNARDGQLYSIGSSVANPGAFLELASVDPASGAVKALAPLLIDNVLECVAGVDPASGVLAFSYTGPLQMQAVATAVLDPGSKAQPLNALTSNGSVMAVAPLPGGSADGTPGVLYLSQDGAGSMWALMLLDAVSGNATALAPIPRAYVNPSQGALVYHAPSASAYALAQYVDEAVGNVDALLTFNLTGLAWAGGVPSLPGGGAGAMRAVRVNDTAVAPNGLWGLAVTSSG